MTQQEIKEWFAKHVPEVHEVRKVQDEVDGHYYCAVYTTCARTGNPLAWSLIHDWDPWIPQFEKYRDDYYRDVEKFKDTPKVNPDDYKEEFERRKLERAKRYGEA